MNKNLEMFLLHRKLIKKYSKKSPITPFPIACKCGKYYGKNKRGKLCGKCQTRVTFKMEHTK